MSSAATTTTAAAAALVLREGGRRLSAAVVAQAPFRLVPFQLSQPTTKRTPPRGHRKLTARRIRWGSSSSLSFFSTTTTTTSAATTAATSDDGDTSSSSSSSSSISTGRQHDKGVAERREEEGEEEKEEDNISGRGGVVAARVVRGGRAVSVRFEYDDGYDNDESSSTSYSSTIFHAQWLWANDPAFYHASSGQRTRSPSSYYYYFFSENGGGDGGGGGAAVERKIASVRVIDAATETTATGELAVVPTSLSPPPPPGCLLPVGSVYGSDRDEDDDGPARRRRRQKVLLCVTWESSGGGTESSSFQSSYYDAEWLARCRYDESALRQLAEETHVHKGIALNCRCEESIRQIEYGDLPEPIMPRRSSSSSSPHDDDLASYGNERQEDALFRTLDAVVENGAVLIRNAPSSRSPEHDGGDDTAAASTVSNLGRLFADGLSHGHLYGDAFHVRSVSHAKNIAYTSEPLPPHQDLAYYESKPGLQLLHCIRNVCTGGESTLMDAMAAATEFRTLAPDLFDVLASVDATFLKQRRDADMLYRSPHIDVDAASGCVVGIRWSPPFEGPVFGPEDVVEDYFVAYAAFERMLDNSLPRELYIAPLAPALEAQLRDYANEYTWERQLKPGDVLVFNNQRMLHGRRGFDLAAPSAAAAAGNTGGGSDGAQRHLAGCYTNMEETLSKYRLLRRRRGQRQRRKLGPEWCQRNAGNGSSGIQ